MDERRNQPFQFRLFSVFVLTAVVAIAIWYGSLIPRNYVPMSVVGFAWLATGELFLPTLWRR